MLQLAVLCQCSRGCYDVRTILMTGAAEGCGGKAPMIPGLKASFELFDLSITNPLISGQIVDKCLIKTNSFVKTGQLYLQNITINGVRQWMDS